jgi:hypothetical protein
MKPRRHEPGRTHRKRKGLTAQEVKTALALAARQIFGTTPRNPHRPVWGKLGGAGESTEPTEFSN